MPKSAIRIMIIATGLLVLSAQGWAQVPPIDFRADLPALRCVQSNDFCEITVQAGTLTYADRQHNGATVLSNFVLNVITINPSGGPKVVNVIANFDQYNQSEDYPAGGESIYVKFIDKPGNYLPDVAEINFDRSNCRDIGHHAVARQIGDIFNSGAVAFEITQLPLTASIGLC